MGPLRDRNAGDANNEEDVADKNHRCGGVSQLGVIYPGSETSMRHITDGSSNTFVLGERTYQLPLVAAWGQQWGGLLGKCQEHRISD